MKIPSLMRTQRARALDNIPPMPIEPGSKRREEHGSFRPSTVRAPLWVCATCGRGAAEHRTADGKSRYRHVYRPVSPEEFGRLELLKARRRQQREEAREAAQAPLPPECPFPPVPECPTFVRIARCPAAPRLVNTSGIILGPFRLDGGSDAAPDFRVRVLTREGTEVVLDYRDYHADSYPPMFMAWPVIAHWWARAVAEACEAASA